MRAGEPLIFWGGWGWGFGGGLGGGVGVGMGGGAGLFTLYFLSSSKASK